MRFKLVNYELSLYNELLLFKLSGNFGIAIVLITLAIRIIFFPLANYSFRSMAKMKAVQPEMTRLKELHKDDKIIPSSTVCHVW